MFICRNAEEVHGQQNVGNPCCTFKFLWQKGGV